MTEMGGKPSKGTKKDRRLKSNKGSASVLPKSKKQKS